MEPHRPLTRSPSFPAGTRYPPGSLPTLLSTSCHSASPPYPLDAGASHASFLGNVSPWAVTIPRPSGLLPGLPATSIQGNLLPVSLMQILSITCSTTCRSITQPFNVAGPWALETPHSPLTIFFPISLLLNLPHLNKGHSTPLVAQKSGVIPPSLQTPIKSL